jgi:hypothetical protein
MRAPEKNVDGRDNTGKYERREVSAETYPKR